MVDYIVTIDEDGKSYDRIFQGNGSPADEARAEALLCASGHMKKGAFSVKVIEEIPEDPFFKTIYEKEAA